MDELTEIKTLLKGIADILPTLATKDDVAKVAADVSTLKSDVHKLQLDGIDLKTGLDELRHVVAANHFKVIGRIDQVASMLADHMADPHGSHAPWSKPAAE
jgi:hypothetical protein